MFLIFSWFQSRKNNKEKVINSIKINCKRLPVGIVLNFLCAGQTLGVSEVHPQTMRRITTSNSTEFTTTSNLSLAIGSRNQAVSSLLLFFKPSVVVAIIPFFFFFFVVNSRSEAYRSPFAAGLQSHVTRACVSPADGAVFKQGQPNTPRPARRIYNEHLEVKEKAGKQNQSNQRGVA